MNRARVILLAVGMVGMVLMTGLGCRPKKSTDAKDALVDQLNTYGGPATAQLRVGKPAQAKQNELPGKVEGTGWHIPWYAPDPKNPRAPLQRILIADAVQGSMDNGDETSVTTSVTSPPSDPQTTTPPASGNAPGASKDQLVITLKTVHATLYHEDKPSATLVSPNVKLFQGDRQEASKQEALKSEALEERKRRVVAWGGVTVRSLDDPTANPKTTQPRTKHKLEPEKPTKTTVTSDRMDWDMSTTLLVCTGNAVLTVDQPGSPQIVQRSNKITYDTKTHRFDVTN